MVQINNSTTPVSYKQEKLTIPANGQVKYQQVYNTIRIVDSNANNQGDLLFQFGALSSKTEFWKGLCISYPEELPSVTIFNMTNADIDVVIATAIGTIQDDRLNVSGTVTTQNQPYTSVNASLETFDSNGEIAINSTGYKRVVLQNMSNTDSFFIFSNNTFELQPTATFDMELSSNFTLYGTVGEKVSVAYFN